MIAAVLSIIFFDSLGAGLIIPALPGLLETFSGTGPAQVSLTYGGIISLYSVGLFIASPLLGQLSDRFGRKPIFIVTLTGAMVDYAIMASFSSVVALAVGRLLAGICGANFPTASAYLTDILPPERRDHGFGWVGAAFGLGFIVGPVVGGLMAGLGLRAPFWGAAGLAAANALFSLLVLRESRVRPGGRLEVEPEAYPGTRLPRGGLNPLAPLLRLFSDRQFQPLLAALLLYHLAMLMIQSIWVLFTQVRFGWTAAQVGLSLTVFGLMAAVVQGGLVGPVLGRLGGRAGLLIGLAVSVAGCLLYGLATAGWQLYAVLVVASLGWLVPPAIQSLASRGVEAEAQGMLQGGLMASYGGASAVAPVISTAVFTWADGERHPGAVFFLASALVAVAFMIVAQRRPDGALEGATDAVTARPRGG
ncbi:MFS transporter [Nitrospirillum amazonense]|nr:MFS transporter [Nitrospirillum amazonense]